MKDHEFSVRISDGESSLTILLGSEELQRRWAGALARQVLNSPLRSLYKLRQDQDIKAIDEYIPAQFVER